MILIDNIDRLQEIHQSNASTVFLGLDRIEKQKVAVKVLNDEFPSAKQLAYFNGEADLTSRFNIKGVRKVIAKTKYKERHALLMEYVDGQSIRAIIDEKNTINIERFLNIAIKIASILTEIHHHGIIHKDINPRNILIDNREDIYVIDLGIATLAKKEDTELQAPEHLEGTLAYISPEQTGRMNKSIDARSDLYSLGVTFYEMISGILPFNSTDSMELVHSHIAKVPPSPHEIRKDVPIIVSDIIMKLLAKDSDDRYQTAKGLRNDLERCLNKLIASGKSDLDNYRFKLAEQDQNNVFQLPEKLYGRDQERSVLLDAFATIEQGGFRVVTVGGVSGIGKTALIKELYKPVTEKRSYFITGKFEQFHKSTPYYAITQAIDAFVNQLLGESERRLAHWKREMLDALGNNAGVLTDLVPSLELIIGKQASPIPLPPVESQNRFNLVFQRFFRELSTQKHALVVFLDDWQWADLSSLNLLKLLMEDTDNQYLLLLVAYRNNEVNATHPFVKCIEEADKIGVPMASIHLDAIKVEHIISLLVDTLRVDADLLKKLGAIVYEKTSGNPFFVSQFITNLYEQGYISYSSTGWTWSDSQVAMASISNNVLELMASRLEVLPANTQSLMQIASCMGASFSLFILAKVAGLTMAEVRNQLLPALEGGLLLPGIGSHYSIMDEPEYKDATITFKFLHDRVQQAAHVGVNEEQKKLIHWKIGQALLNLYPDAEEHIFEVASHLDNGFVHAKSEEIPMLVELNHNAALRAKSSNAYSSAVFFFGYAIQFFKACNTGADAFDLYKHAAEANYLAGFSHNATDLYRTARAYSASDMQKVDLYCSQLQQYQTEGRFEDAYQLEKEGLKLLGILLPDSEEAILPLFQEEIGKVSVLLGSRSIEELEFSQATSNDEKVLLSNLLGLFFATSYLSGKSMSVAWSGAKLSNLSLEYGTSIFSPFSYSAFALLSVVALGDYSMAYQFGKLAIKLSLNNPILAIRAKVHHIFPTFISHWHNHPRHDIHFYDDAVRYGLDGGDFEYVAHASIGRMHNKLSTPENIHNLYSHELWQVKSLISKTNPALIGWSYEPGIILPVLCFLGQTKALNSLETDDFSEAAFAEKYAAMPLALCWLHISKIRTLYTHAFYEEALGSIDSIPIIEAAHAGLLTVPLSHYYGALIIMANWDTTNSAIYKDRLAAYIAKIEGYASYNPAFYAPKLAFIRAEYCAQVDDSWEAIKRYDEAMQLSIQAEDHKQEGMVSERLALFALKKGIKDIAKIYMQRAIYAYGQWGAEGKVKQLREKYAELLPMGRHAASSTLGHTITGTILGGTTMSTGSSAHTSTYGGSSLDLLSVMKASQAISEEIKLDLLLRKMILVLMENAGAERAMLIQDQGDELMVAAEAHTGSATIEIMRAIPLTKEDKDKVALSVIRNVYRTQETVVSGNIQKDQRFAMDPYIQQQKAKSVLCMPVIHQGKVRLVIYMEHSQVFGAFTNDRIHVLNMLSSQVAISIENSVLYDTLEQKVEERTKELKNANAALHQTNLRITDSINYAQTMQHAILPTDNELNALSTEHFVLYRPKDIVSGDFYWYTQIADKHILAVVDCTGHGVPGAFMSMIGNTLLDELVNQKGIVDPAEILEGLDKGVRISLSQETSNNTDGMDLAICAITFNDNGSANVTYAGAKSPIYYMSNGELGRLDPDRRAIGGFIYRAGKGPFQNKELILAKGDALYLTTDGYVDAGDGNHRSFSKKAFMELIQEVWQKSMGEQLAIFTDRLERHQGNTPQRDDITVVGIRI